MIKNFLLFIFFSFIVNTAQAMEEEYHPFSPTYRHLPTYENFSRKDLGRCAQVSHQWDTWSSEDFFWKPMVKSYAELDGLPMSMAYRRLPKLWKNIMKRAILETSLASNLAGNFARPTISCSTLEDRKKNEDANPNFKPTPFNTISIGRIVL